MEEKRTEGDRADRNPAEKNAPPSEFAAVFARLVADERDLIGMIAYGRLHLGLQEWSDSFERTHNRAPGPAEWSAVLLAETRPGRLEAYLKQAEQLLQAHQAPLPPDSEANGARPVPPTTMSGAIALAAAAGALPRLLGKLAMLGVAVVFTALLVRFYLWS